MKQKLEDFITLLKRDRKTQILSLLGGLAVLFLIFAPSNEATKKPVKKPAQKQTSPTSSQREVMDDVMLAVRRDLQNVQEQSSETAKKLDESMKRSSEYEQRTAEIFKRILEQMADDAPRKGSVGSLPSPEIPGFPGGGAGSMDMAQTDQGAPVGSYTQSSYDTGYGGISEPLELETIGFADKQVMPPPAPDKQRVAFVGKGDSVRLKLLAGVNAPTDGTPYPVVFKMIGDVHGPDGSQLPLGEARVVAAAQGSLVDSRVLFRLSSIDMRLPSGRHKVIDVDGWVVGEDGIRGMEGILIDPFGKAIAAAGFAGVLQGLGQAAADQQVTNTTNALGGSQAIVTGDDTTYALGKGLGTAAETYARLIEKRANLLVPHVEVLSGREATAVFSKSFVIEGLLDDMEEDDSASMASLN